MMREKLFSKTVSMYFSSQSLADYLRNDKDLHTDSLARLRGLGMSERDIEEFEEYWKAHTEEK